MTNIWPELNSDVFSSDKQQKLRSRFYKVVQLHKNALGELYKNVFANFLHCTSAKNYENQLTCLEVMSKDKVILSIDTQCSGVGKRVSMCVCSVGKHKHCI